MKSYSDARYVAVQVLTEVVGQRHSLSDRLDHHLPQMTSPREQALTQALCYGVMRLLPRLDTILQQMLHKPLKNKDNDVYTLLLLGIYQLLYMRVPAYAAIAATVKVADALKKTWAKGLVNAVLRKVQTQQASLLAAIESTPVAQYAHPDWLLQRLQQDWQHQWADIAVANNTHPPLTVRVNLRQLSRAAYLDALQAVGIAATPTPHSHAGLVLAQAVDVQQLPGFTDGWVSVQDGAAQLAAGLLDVRDNTRVLDMCAAPGGKTAHLLERHPAVALTALDNQPQRVTKLAETLQRLQLTAELRCADASQPHHWWDKRPYERILLDVPCSATGVIRRHPDIKYLRRASDIEQLTQQQAALLAAAWQCLAVGGKLLYVTCSVLKAENTEQIKRFIAHHHNAMAVPFAATWGHAQPIGRQILPGEDNFDGFYYACLTKLE